MSDKYRGERTLIMELQEALENARRIRELQMQDDIKKMARGSKKRSSGSYERAPFEPEEGSFGEAVLKIIFFAVLIGSGAIIFSMLTH